MLNESILNDESVLCLYIFMVLPKMESPSCVPELKFERRQRCRRCPPPRPRRRRPPLDSEQTLLHAFPLGPHPRTLFSRNLLGQSISVLTSAFQASR